MVKKNVADLKPEELKGKVVFVRADLNVPQVRGRAGGGSGGRPRRSCSLQLLGRCRMPSSLAVTIYTHSCA